LGSPENYVPSVQISESITGTKFLSGSDNTITGGVEVSDGTIKNVNFFDRGNNKIAEDVIAHYSFTFTD